MSEKPILIDTNTDSPESLTVVGTSVKILANETQTQGGAFTLQSGEAGMGPPPHAHVWSEAFFVTKGSVEFMYNGETQICAAGSFVFIPPNITHTFTYGPDGGEMLEITGAGSNATQLFADLATKLEPGPPDMPTVIEIFTENKAELRI